MDHYGLHPNLERFIRETRAIRQREAEAKRKEADADAGLEATQGRNENGTRWLAYEVAGWSVTVQEEPAGGLWSVYVLPDDCERRFIRPQGARSLPWEEAVRTARQIAEALNHVTTENARVGARVER